MWDSITKSTKWLVNNKKIYFTEGTKDGNLTYLIHTDEIPLFMSNHHKPATTFFMKPGYFSNLGSMPLGGGGTSACGPSGSIGISFCDLVYSSSKSGDSTDSPSTPSSVPGMGGLMSPSSIVVSSSKAGDSGAYSGCSTCPVSWAGETYPPCPPGDGSSGEYPSVVYPGCVDAVLGSVAPVTTFPTLVLPSES